MHSKMVWVEYCDREKITFIHAFIFYKCAILVKFIRNPDALPGHKAEIHPRWDVSLLLIHTSRSIHLSACGRPTKTPCGEHWNVCRRLNWETGSCKMASLP